MTKLEILKSIDFGSRVAEDETDRLIEYFVETDQWRRIFDGEIDIVYGPKGSGKSAIYTVLIRKENELFDRDIVLRSGENPSGTPAFQGLVTDPPTTEEEFIALWKLYVASLVASIITDFGIENAAAKKLIDVLSDSGLIPPPGTLGARVKRLLEYVRRGIRVETDVTVDPATGVPVMKGRVVFTEPSVEQAQRGFISVDDLLATADDALAQEALTAWLLFDRLDVAFSGSPNLERNALRALFRTYLDVQRHRHITLKIFLRTDIWTEITAGGFREASHITRTVTIDWTRAALLSLTLRRLLQSQKVCEYYDVDPQTVLASADSQESFIKRVFPLQIDTGRNPETFDWIIGRSADASGRAAPRELIHLLIEARNHQIEQLEAGGIPPDEERLFDRQAFRAALPAVSKVRLEQTVYAEYPDLKEYLEALRDQKATQHVASLSDIWGVDSAEAAPIARRLVEVGVFEELPRSEGSEYRVPFLYRPALGVIQGRAED